MLTELLILPLLIIALNGAVGAKYVSVTGIIFNARDTAVLSHSRMEKFDKLNYDKFQVNGIAKFKRKDGAEITLTGIGPYFVEKIKSNVNSPYTSIFKYFKGSLKLKSYAKTFYGFVIGSTKEYDEDGKLVKESNRDVGFKFSIESLIEKMLREYNINLLNPIPGILVYRQIRDDTNEPEYVVEIPIQGLTNKHIIIDGNTALTKKEFIATNVEY